ncbi:MAG: M1 family metallopeptidase, partial [Candidatus Zixiibacteriota bacterium]
MMLSKVRAVGILLAVLFLLADRVYSFDTLRVDATLDTLRKDISGSVTFVLPLSPDLSSFELQLFPNVYSSEETPYLRERKFLRKMLKDSNVWGEMLLDSVVLDGANITRDVNVDYTRAVYRPEQAAKINGKSVRIYFRTRLPEKGDRLSTMGGTYFLDGWFPYPGILKDDGSWYSPNYTSFAELVGDFYQYDVTLHLPANLKIASAVPPEIIESEDTLAVNRFSFGPAHDFALVLAPDFLVDSADKDEINITVYYQPGDLSSVERVKEAARFTIEYMEKKVGPYPYDRLNCAIFDMIEHGGVEMPGLIALSKPRGPVLKTHLYDMLVIHETIHQWFYGIINSNQAEYPWMDEALTDYFTLKIMEEKWGIEANLFDFAGFKVSERDQLRMASQMSADYGAINRPASAFVDEGDYYGTVYMRGAFIIETFNNLLGDSLSNLFWRNYYEQFKFKSPTPEDFISVAWETCGEKIKTAIDELIYHVGPIDYSIQYMSNRQIDSVTFETEIVLQKEGNLSLPVGYRLVLYNGDTLDYVWEANYHSEKIILKLPSPVIEVILDPDHIIAVDDDLANNSMTARTDNRPAFRLS